MTLADGEKSRDKEQRWEDEDVDLTASGSVGQDLVVELKLSSDECQEELQFILFRGDLPMPSDRYQIHTRGNVVQLTLKESQKDDAGHYALVARKLSTGLSIPGDERVESRRKIRLSIQDPSQGIDEGEPPIFVRRLSDLAVKVGTRTRFLVEIRSSTSPKVTWHKNDEPVQSGSRFSFVHEGNFYCVDVAPVMVDDQGHWTCMAENGGGRSSCTSFLNVIVPKAYKKPEFVEELRALLTETGTVSLECKVVGVPTPVLKWFKDQKEIKAGDVFALTANPDDPTSLGTYTCEAVNCMGTACSSSRVHVVGKGSREGSLKPADALTPSGPLPVFKKILRDESCRIGDSLTLSCQVTVPPWPKTITWYNKEGRVEPSEKYHIIADGLGGYSIEIKGVEAMDEGEWKCVATSFENMKQFSTCYVAMSIPKNYRVPRFMESLKAVLTEEGLVSFECKVVGFPTPLLRWFKDGQELHPGDVYQLTGTNSLGSYCCIARNCMGETKSTAELTVEDIQNQLNEEERMQLMSSNQAPKFVKGLRSCEARINEDFTFTIQVSVSPEPSLSWYRDDVPIIESEKYRLAREALGACHLEVKKLEFVDQAEWKCVAANDFGHSVTSCFLKLVIPKHFKKPKFLESLRAILSEEGAVNLECKVIGVPQPVLKWYKDGVELKPGDIHRIISGQDGTCCLGTYTCEATNCMGSVSSSASLLGFEDRVSVRKEEAKEPVPLHELARNLSLSTIHEERTSQMYDTPQTDHSITLDDRGEVSFSFDGKEVSVSLYETPDLTEEEALQIVEMYADQLSEHITEGNVIELPPMRFTKETSTTGNLLMEAVVIDVSPDYFIPDEEADDLRTEADVEDVSIMDDQMQSIRSSSYISSPIAESPGDRVPSGSPPSRPPRRKESRESVSSRSERSDKSLPKGFDWSESYHSAKEPSMQAQSSLQGHDDSGEAFTDALSSSGAGRSKAEESKDLYASFVEQTVEKIPLDETMDLSREKIDAEDPISMQVGEALVQEIPAKRKKKKKTKGSRTPSLSSKASSEESYSIEPEEKVKRRGSKSAKGKGDRRGSESSNKSADRDRRSRSNSENGKFESAASTDRRRRESDATIVVEDVRIEQTDEIGEINTTNNFESTQTKTDTGLVEERPASAASMASTIESEKSSSKTNKERLLENVYKLSEPILSLRNALVDLDSLLPLLQTDGTPEDVERSQMEIVQRIVVPVENLCDQVSAIETKALKSAGDRSLAQNVRISLLEAVGGPTEELLRGIELIRRHSDQPQDPKAHLIVLESLTDPVDEILVGLTKIEHELTSPDSELSLVSLEKPIALERMCRAVSRLGTNVGMISERKLTFGDESTRCSVIERLQSVYQSLEAFLSTIPLSDVSGALENNVDTLVVETLVRPLEELSKKLHIFSTANVQTQNEQDNVVAGLEKSMSEMRTRLEALTIALETYEKESGEQGITELHADLVKFLRYTMDDAVERLEKLKLNKKRVTQEMRAEETAGVTPMIFDGKSRQDSDIEELAAESIVESSEPEESNVLKDLAEEAAKIMKKVTVPSIVEAEISETESQLLQEKSKFSKTAEKSSTEAEEEPPVKKDRKKKQKKDLSREESGEASSSAKARSRIPPELDPDLSLPEMLLDPLIDVQANLSDVISDFESQESAEESSLPGSSELAACLTELRECVATAAHTATTLKSANTVNALVDLREPLLDLQLAMASAVSPEEVKLIQEATVPLAELKVIVAAAIRSPQASEASQVQMKPVLRMLEDIEAEVAKVSQQKATPQVAEASPAVSEPKETRSIPKRPPEEVERAAVTLTGVHFALSTALERVTAFAAESADSLSLSSQQGNQAKAQKVAEQSAASNLIVSIEELRQCVGTLAVAIGTPVTSTDSNDQYSYDILFDELAKLEEPLLNLQKVLLTEVHGPEDRHVLNDVASPIRSLKEVVQDVTRDVGGGSTPIVLELIEDVEKDVSLIAMEALKKALAGKSDTSDDDGRASVSSDLKPGEVPGIILKWLDPIEDWLTSTAEEGGEIENARATSSIAPAVDDLKRELLKIAIQTSYSEPPSDVALIESLTELQEPLSKVCQVLAECHEPENLDIVEGLIQPTKHLLGTILDASMTHEAGKVLRPVLEAIEELENQIPLTIQRATYERELQRVVRSMTPEEPETLMADDIPETSEETSGLMEIRTGKEIHESFEESSRKIATSASEVEVRMEEGVQALSREESLEATAKSSMTVESRKERAEGTEVAVQESKSTEKPDSESKIAPTVQESEKAVEEIAQTLSLAEIESLETRGAADERVQAIEVTEEKGTSKEKAKLSRQVATADSQLEEMVEGNIQALSQEDSASLPVRAESLKMEELKELAEAKIIAVEEDKLKENREAPQKTEIASISEVTKENTQLLNKDDIALAQAKLASLKKEASTEHAEVTVEQDKSKEKLEPSSKIATAASELEVLAEEKAQAISEEDSASLQAKAESSESEQSKHRAETTEAAILQDESKKQFDATSELGVTKENAQVLSQENASSSQIQVDVSKAKETKELSESSKDAENQDQSKAENLVRSDTIEVITVDSRPFVEEVTSLQPQQATETTLVDTNRAEQLDLWTLTLLGPLDRLGNAVLALDRSLDEEAHGLLCRPLDSLHKQIESAESQFNRLAGQSLENDVETIIEGFLSPVNQLHSALSSAIAVWTVEEPQPVVNQLLQAMADSSTELCELLDSLRNKLVLERSQTRQEQQEDASLVETITAVLAPLDNLRNLIETTLKSPQFMNLAKRGTEDSVLKDRHHKVIEGVAEEQEIINEDEKIHEQTDLAARSLEQKAQSREEKELSTASVSRTETVAAAAKGDEISLQDEIALDKDVELTAIEKATAVVEPILQEKATSSKPEVAKGLKKGSKGKEESMDIEEKTAKPLEELIEAIVDSSGPRPVSSSPEDYQSITPDVADDNLDKTEMFLSEESIDRGIEIESLTEQIATDTVPEESVKELEVEQLKRGEAKVLAGETLAEAETVAGVKVSKDIQQSLAEIESTENVAAEKLQEISADEQKKHKAKVLTEDNLAEAGKIEAVVVSKGAQQVVTENVAKSNEAGIAKISQIDAETQALKEAEESETNIQEERVGDAGSEDFQKKEATLVTEESLAKAEGRKQESLVLESSTASQENVSSEDVEEMVTEELKKQKAESRDSESAGKVGVTDAPEIRVKPLDAEVSETFEVLEEGVQEISTDNSDNQMAELRENEGLSKADVKEAPQTRLKAIDSEITEAQELLQESLQELSTEEMQKQKGQLSEGESLATASVKDAPEMKIKAMDPEISEISKLPEESVEETTVTKLDEQKAELREGESLDTAGIMNAPETKIKSMDAQVVETTELPEEGVEEIVAGKLDTQTAEIREAENLAKAGVTDAPETKVEPRDAQVLETSELPEESVEEIATGKLDEQKAKMGEAESLAKAGVTDAPETKIKPRDAQVSETSELPEESVEEIATGKLDEQKAKIGEAENLAKAGVTDTPETKIKPRDAQVSEASELPEESVEEIATGKLDEQKAKIGEAENLAKAGVTDAPETKIKPRDAQVSEASELPEESVEEIATGKLDEQKAKIGEAENLAKAGVTDAPETKIKPRDAQVSEASELPEESVEEIATGKLDEQKAKMGEAENLAKAGVTDAPETKIKPMDAQVSEASELPEESVEEIATGKLDEQKAKIGEAENLAKAGVTDAPETKIKAREAQVSETSELPEESVEEIATEKLEEQKAKMGEAKNLAKAGVTDAPETKIKPRDAQVSETSELPEESVEEIATGKLDEQKAKMGEAENLAKAGVTDAPETKIKPRDAQVSEASELPEESVEEIATGKLDEQKAKIGEAENLAKAGVVDAPETKIKPRDAQVSETSELLEESAEGIVTSELDKQKAELLETEKLVKAGVTKAPETKVKPIDATVSETSELPEERVEEIVSGISEKKNAELRVTEELTEAGVADTPEVKIKAREVQVSETLEHPEESVSEIVNQNLEKQAAISEDDSFTKVNVADAPETKLKPGDVKTSEKSTVLQKAIQEIMKSELQPKAQKAIISVMERQIAQIAKIEAEEVAKFSNEETIEAAESAIVEIIETPTQKIFKMKKEATTSGEPEEIVERIIVKPVEEVVAMEDQHIIETIETPTEKVIKMKLAVERKDGVVEEVVEEIVVKKPTEGWATTLVEEERQAVSVSDARVQELIAGKSSSEGSADLGTGKQQKAASKDTKTEADMKADGAASTTEEGYEKSGKEEDKKDKKDVKSKNKEEGRLRQEEVDKSQEQKNQEAEQSKQEESERLKKEQNEKLLEVETEKLKKEELDRQEKAKQEKEREEIERLERKETERLKREEAERLEKEELVRQEKARQEAERLKREEEERKKKEEEERLRKEEAEKLEREERERQEKLEAERLKKEEEERLRKEEAEKLEKEERDRQEKLEAERLKKEEEERLQKEEAEKLEKEKREREEKARLEAERLKQEELERAKKEEEERVKKEEAERLKKEELERAKKEEEERLKKEEAERLKKEELERAKKEEEERLKKEEAERLKKEELERAKKEEEERLKKEEAERLKKEELERAKKEEEERLKKEEAERLKKEELERAKKEEEERLKKEEAERLKNEELERAKKEEEERLKKEEAAKIEKEKREKEEAAKLEKEKLEKEEAAKLEKQKLEKEEAAKLEKQKLEKEEAAKLEKEKLEKEEAAKLEKEKLEKEEAAKLEKEKLEKEESAKLEKEKLEKEAAAKLEKEKLEKEEAAKLEKEKLEKEKAAKLEKEKLEKEAATKLEKEKLEKEEAAKLEKEKLEKEAAAKLEKEKLEKEEAAKLEKEKLEKEKAAKLEKEKLEKEEAAKLEKEKLEKEEAAKLEKEKLEKEEAAKLEKEKLEKEEASKLEKEKLAKEKEESERSKKKERKRAEKKEAERLKKEEEDRLKTEEDERLKKEEQLEKDKVQRENEEAERLKNEELERQQKEVAERLKDEEQERRRREEAEVAEKETLLQQEQADAERTKKKELKRQQKEEAKRSKTDDSKEETRRSSKKAKNQKSIPKEPEDQAQAISTTKPGDEDDDKTPVNSEHEITDKPNKPQVYEDPEMDRDPRSTSTIRTDSEMESEYSESSKSAISRDAAVPSRRRRSGQQIAIEVDYDMPKERSERRGSDRPILNRMRDDTLSSDERHYTPHYSATSRSHEFAPGPRDRGKKPSFCTKLTDRTAAEASRIKLTCTVLGDPEPQIYWTKDGAKLPNSSNRHCVIEENGMISLEFYGALPKDSGEYSCVAKNVHGQAHTNAKLKVYAGYEPSPAVPTFTRSIKDTYHSAENELVLECRVRGQPSPKITWLKDGQTLQIGDRYQQCDLGDGLCRLKISNPDFYDSGLYTCRAENDSKISDRTSHVVNFEGKGKEHGWRGSYRNLTSTDIDTGRPRFSSYLTDHSVPAGGTIALQVEVKGVPPPDITWMRGDRREPIPSYKARTFADSGVYTLIVPEATESETGTYVCRASNAYGYVDTTANVQVVSSSSIDGGKAAMFISRPAETMIYVTVGEDVSVSFRVNGVPKPRIVWMKGMRDITNGPRSYKESIDDYVRLTLKRALVSDEGTYCILAKNRYGCDRTFYTVKVKQRARSLTPSPDWGSVDTDNLLANIHDTERSYLKQVPGPISSEPVIVDGGRNWLALSWGKAVQHGPAPVVAYRVDAWLLGGEGGARWSELGITPVNAYDAFNLRPGGEYKFRITPRNRYGWGEAVTMTNSVTVREVVKFPEFSKILTGQLKALRGETLHLECEVRSESKAEVKWYRDTTDIDALEDPRYMTYFNGSKSTVTVQAIKEHDSGRYVCEAINPAGRVSTFARVQVVTDPKIVEADEKLRRMRTLEPNNEERPPEFTMRLRDRRVQMTYPVRLTCQVSGHPEPDVQWYKNREEIFEDGNISFWDDESHFHTLEISHSTLEDSGIYMARARNVNGSVSCRCHLVVDKGIRAYVAPEFFRHLDAVYTVKAGGELRMTAQIEAYPTVGIVWHRDGHRLRPSRSAVMTLNHDGSVELSLAYVTPRDAGLYCCTATNEVGQTESTTRVTVIGAADEEPSSLSQSLPDVVESLDVPYSKEPLFVTKPLSTEAVEGDTVIILCEVVGDPKPEVIWLRDFLRPDYYRDAAHFRRVGAGPQYRLEIPYAKLDFTGAYSVIAKNCHGEAKAIISLQIYARGQGKTDNSMEQATIKHGNVQTLPSIKRPLRDLRCCDGDAVTLICRVHATPEPDVRWEKGGKLVALGEDFAADFDGETARLSIQHVYPEDEGEYTCVAYNDLGKAFTSACLIVDVPEGKESVLSRRLIRPVGLLSAESTPISTPRSTPVRSLSPSCRRELKPAARTPRGQMISRRPRLPTGPKFYAVPHNRVAEEGETVRFQCAVAGHPSPWVIWDKDGVSVTPTARISLKEKDDVRILEIAEITHEDAGLYRITLENDVGRTEATARLEIIKGRQNSVTRSIRTRSASPRTYSIYSRSPITSAIRGDTHLRPNIYEPMSGRGGTLSPTLPKWHHRNGKPPIESPEPVRRMNKRTSAPARTPLKNGVTPKDQKPAPKNPSLKIPTKPRSSSVPKQNESPKDALVHITNVRQTKTSSAQKTTNEAKIRSNNHSKTTIAPTTNGSMIPKRLPISRSRSPKISTKISRPPKKFIDSVDFCESMIVPVSEVCDVLVAAEKEETAKPAAPLNCHEEILEAKIPPLVKISPPTKCHEILSEDSRNIVQETKEPRAPVILAAPADVIALRGAKVILLATFDGEPQPRVRWLRRGRDVKLDDKAEIETSRGLTCLTLEGVTTEQAGKYAVTLENATGRDCRYVNVTVEGVPDPPAGTPCVQSITRAGKAIVTWRSPPYDGGCAVTGYNVEMKRGEEPCWVAVAEARHSLSHTVTGLESEEIYRFRVRAENAHGVSEPSTVSDVVTVPGEHDEEIGGQVFVAEINQIEIEEEEEEFEPAFEARIVSPEEGSNFEKRYEIKEELGKGRYGIVKRIVEKSSGLNLAAKFVRTIKAKDRQQVYEEIGIMNMLRHPKLLRLAAAFESPKEMIMVTEYISGGELFERVVADDFTLTEKDSIQFVKQICEGVEYMHTHSVVHLDLKPENIMCHTRTSHRIKLIDFGLAQTLKPDTPVRVLFGTPEFIPPEIIGFEPIGTESDMWSVGVICYVLLTGLSPFMGDNDAETFANITRADFDFDDKAFTAISQEAKDFISALLIKRKELRMSAKQCLEHAWLAQRAESMSRVALPTDKLKKFIVRRKWQKTGNAIRALGRMAILSANSRRNLSAGSSPTKTEFGDELFADVTTNPHGFKPIQPIVVVEDRTEENNLEKPEEIGEELVKPIIEVEDRTGDNNLEKPEEIVEELGKPIFKVEDRTEEIYLEKPEEIAEVFTKPIVKVEDRTGEYYLEKLEEINEEFIKPIVKIEDSTEENYLRKPEEIVEEDTKSDEPETDEFLNSNASPEDKLNSENYTNGLHVEENCSTVTELETTQILEAYELRESKPLIQEIDDLILIEANKKSIHSGTEMCIEELSNEICTESEVSTDFNATGSSHFKETPRKLSFSSFVNLEITETGIIEVSQSSEPEERLRIEESDESIDYETKVEDEAEDKEKEDSTVYNEEISDILDNNQERQQLAHEVIEKTPVVTKAWCKNINPLPVDEEDEDARLMGRVRTRHIVCTGSVSRTAKMFEKEEEANSLAQKQQNPVNRSTPMVPETRPQNERIRKAFAFWNK